MRFQATGKVSYELKHPFRDGTNHILFTSLDFIAVSNVESQSYRVETILSIDIGFSGETVGYV